MIKQEQRTVGVAELGERLAPLRLREAAALESMRRSLVRHGQLMPIVVFADGEGLEVLDGFKRVYAARALGWVELAALTSAADVVEAKIELAARHDGRGLTELEEAWLVRSLCRDDKLPQFEVARRLARHKSWVCRRLMLVEALVPEVQAEVRLGLCAPRAAVALAALPRGNQRAASALVIRNGLTVRQTEVLVAQLLEQPETARAAWLATWQPPASVTSAGPRPRVQRSEADWMAADLMTVMRVAARLQARLSAKPLGAFGGAAANVILDGLLALEPVLGALARTLAKVTGKEQPS